MADKLKEMEERLDKLENRLKVTFLEIEKRFESFKEEQPVSVEDRLQELEDLLLLIQLEITKLKESETPLEFGAPAPDVNERLNKLEEALVRTAPVAAAQGKSAPAALPASYSDMEHRIRELEAQISARHAPFVEGKAEHAATAEFSDKLDEIEKRLERMENKRVVSEKAVVVHHKDVLEDVRKILHA